MSDGFTRDRMEWLDAIASHPELDGGAFKLAYVISGLVNRKTGDAWPSLDFLATKMDMNERSIRRLTEALVSRGFLSKERGGDGRPNRYRLAFPDRTSVSTLSDDRPDTSVHSEEVRTDTSVHSEVSDRTNLPVRPDICVTQTGHPCPPISLNISLNDLSEIDISPPTPSCAVPRKGGGKSNGQDPDFETFFAAYPRKVSKGQARKAWAKAILIEPPDRIIEAARRYAAQRHGEDPRFTKHPGSWLNAEAWLDETPKPMRPGQAPVSFPSRSTAKERTAAAIQHLLASDEKDFQ